ncbi:MAG: hypothetical protein RL679_906 [Bacteroidota bacterium]|jgi:hypothetical protein
MSFDNLFLQLRDVQFQADKILKSKDLEQESLERFAHYSKDLKESLIDLDLNEELLIHVSDIEEIDPDLNPKLPVVIAVLGALSFGAASKKYRKRKREEYFRENIKNIRDRFSNINFLLKDI